MVSYRTVSENIIQLAEIDWSDNEEKKEICLYGMEMLLSTIVNIGIILALGIILPLQMEIIIYIMFFTPLRLCAGGRHARNHMSCIGLYCTCMLLVILGNKICINYIEGSIIIAITLIASLIVEGTCLIKRNGLGEFKTEKRRMLVLIIMLIEAFLVIVLGIIGDFIQVKFTYYAMIASGGMLIQSIFLIPLKRKKYESKSE